MDLIAAVMEPFRRRSAEDVQPVSRWLNDQLFPGLMDLRPTKTGSMLAPEESLENSAVFACFQVITQSIAMLPRHLYRTGKDDSRELATKHRSYRLIKGQPNSETTKFEFEQQMGYDYLGRGNAIAQIIRDGRDFPIAMVRLPAKQIHVRRTPRGDLQYKLRRNDGTERIFEHWEIHHRRGPSLDGVIGLGVWDLARNAIALGLSMEEYACRLYDNDATPRGILQHEQALEPDVKEKVRDEWEERHKGIENRHRIGILDLGLKYTAIAHDNVSSQFDEGRERQNAEICRYLRVPPHMIGLLNRATNNNITQQSKEFLRDTLCPHLTNIEEAMERDLLTEDEREYLYIEHKIEALMKGDFGEQTESDTKSVLNGIESRNEVRKRKNLNPVQGGDKLYVPLNMGMLDPKTGEVDVPAAPDEESEEGEKAEGTSENKDKNAPKTAPKLRNPSMKTTKRAESDALTALEPLFLDAAERIASRECISLSRSLKKFGKAGTYQELSQTTEEWYREHELFVERAMRPLVECCAAQFELTPIFKVRLINGAVRRAQSRARLLSEMPDFVEAKNCLAVWEKELATEIAQAELQAVRVQLQTKEVQDV